MPLPKTPLLTVDAAIVDEKKTLLIQRLNEPFKGFWALPGGFVDVGETVESACIREAFEETGLNVKINGLIGVYSNPKRDPRGHTCTIAYFCGISGGSVKAGDDAKQAGWFPLDGLPDLAFDHKKILDDAINHLMTEKGSV
jgi:8-oxo-dGTP diphosphatase